jgi:ElaB/YqjD/DUF883 family membrane-anchored ribosome-binding protein
VGAAIRGASLSGTRRNPMNMHETMSDTADTAMAKAKPMMDRVSTMATTAADKAYEMKTHAKDWLVEHGDQMTAKQKQMVADASSYISANPFKSIGIAVLAALVVGRLMK